MMKQIHSITLFLNAYIQFNQIIDFSLQLISQILIQQNNNPMQREQNIYTPQYGDHGNIILKETQKSIQGNNLYKTIESSDIILSQFQGYSQKLKSVPIEQFQILRKQLDKPLGFIKSLFSKIINVAPQHQFIMLQTQLFLVTIDFYINNRIVTRIGQKNFVFDQYKSQARRNSQILKEKNGLQWRRIIKKDEQLSLGSVLDLILKSKIKDYAQVSFNGSHFSQQFYTIIQDKLIKPK